MTGSIIVRTGRELAKALRDEREFALLDKVAGVLAEGGYEDPTILKLQAQGMIDDKRPREALPLLEALLLKLPPGHSELDEVDGLIGRACKQIFFDNPLAPEANPSILRAFDIYRRAHKRAPDNTWLGVNVLAIAAYANRVGLPLRSKVDVAKLARTLLTLLESVSEAGRDEFHAATLAEAYLGLGDLEAVETHIAAYVQNRKTTAFALGSTLRQFTDLWQLEAAGERGSGIVGALRAALLRRKGGGQLRVLPARLRGMMRQKRPTEEQLQKILGPEGPRTYDWMVLGLKTARAVGAIRHRTKGRQGTGFLVRGGDFMPFLGDELVVVTNNHVVSAEPRTYGQAMLPADASIAFEAVSADRRYEFHPEVLWQDGKLDCTLLRLKLQPEGIEPIAIGTEPVPPINPRRPNRVYIIGYPGGLDLSFSLQDNDVLDHEAPPQGTPPDPLVWRIQYRAPTAGGSSGSPVLNDTDWRLMALHHAGDEAMNRLNGRPDKWPANEGILIQSIIALTQQAAAENPSGRRSRKP